MMMFPTYTTHLRLRLTQLSLERVDLFDMIGVQGVSQRESMVIQVQGDIFTTQITHALYTYLRPEGRHRTELARVGLLRLTTPIRT
jgi:hypothetical protein